MLKISKMQCYTYYIYTFHIKAFRQMLQHFCDKFTLRQDAILGDLVACLQGQIRGLQSQKYARNHTQSQKQKQDAWFLVKCSDEFRAQYCNRH